MASKVTDSGTTSTTTAGSATASSAETNSLSQLLQNKLSQSKLGQSLPKKLQSQIEEQLKGALGARLDESAQSAKAGLDQALIALEHRGINLKDSPERAQEIAHTIGRKVLERAEAIRSELATKPFSPAWLKDVRIPTDAMDAAPAKSSDTDEASASASKSASTAQASSAGSTAITEATQSEDVQADAVTASATIADESVKKTKRASKKSAASRSAH